MTASFFARQLATYASYHRDPRNRATHMIGIPAIMFSILAVLSLARFHLFGLDLSWAVVAAALGIIGWVALDRVIGIAMIVVTVPMLVVAEWVAASLSATTVWIVFAVFFIGGWIFQLIGHVWEGRRPALVDNLFQAFVGPMFIMAEVLMALGLKQDLKALVDGSPHPAA